MHEDLSHSPSAHPGLTGQTSHLPQPDRPRIGLFDSGVGGLSVLRALQKRIPWADYVYVGDTARLPYGQRSPETIIEYSMQASQFLHESGVDTIVIACNTASSVALSDVQQSFANTLIQGVVEAGAQAASEASTNGRIGVIGTACTVKSGAYEKAITRLIPNAVVHSKACPFLVSLAEEGWTQCEIARMSVEQYLTPLMDEFGADKPDCIILGCTHFSRFKDVLRQLMGPEVTLIDPANSLADQLAARFETPTFLPAENGTLSFYATDALQRFARVGELFLGTRIPQASLQRITLDNH